MPYSTRAAGLSSWPMSLTGQTEKNSVGTNVFRSAPEVRHYSPRWHFAFVPTKESQNERWRAASAHSKNDRRCVGIFLKEHHPSLIVFENVDPVLLYCFACSLCLNG